MLHHISCHVFLTHTQKKEISEN